MKTTLFDEFEPVSSKQWKQKIQYDLKGADYSESLVWQSLEGIHVKPFYHRDEFQQTFEPIPGQPVKWNIIQQVFIDDATIANRLAIDALDRGADAICFSANSAFEIADVFLDFPFDNVTLYFQLNFLSESFLNELLSYLGSKSDNFFLNLDLLGNLARTGNWFHNLKKDHEILEAIHIANSEAPILSVDTSLYQNAGANCVQQLAYGLASANEYLNHFYHSERLGDQITNTSPLTFQVAAGTNYFFEIAKIRALRKLYAVLAQEYGLKPECHIVATPSKRNKTLYDYNVNMLRTATECMSAILGGANAVSNLPYDSLYHKSNEFAERISRNQLLILKSESYFDLVSNSSDGSYYIESLTGQLAQKALELFKEIEDQGGFLKQLEKGVIQQKIAENAEKEQKLFDSGTITLVGTNKFEHKDEDMKDQLELYPFLKKDPRKTLFPPIIPRRLAEKVEQERLDNE